MGEQYYVTVCSRHKTHNEECTACRNFDKALKEKMSGYAMLPHQHPTVVAIQTREWIGRIFPIVKS